MFCFAVFNLILAPSRRLPSKKGNHCGQIRTRFSVSFCSYLSLSLSSRFVIYLWKFEQLTPPTGVSKDYYASAIHKCILFFPDLLKQLHVCFKESYKFVNFAKVFFSVMSVSEEAYVYGTTFLYTWNRFRCNTAQLRSASLSLMNGLERERKRIWTVICLEFKVNGRQNPLIVVSR